VNAAGLSNIGISPQPGSGTLNGPAGFWLCRIMTACLRSWTVQTQFYVGDVDGPGEATHGSDGLRPADGRVARPAYLSTGFRGHVAGGAAQGRPAVDVVRVPIQVFSKHGADFTGSTSRKFAPT